ncbi:alpha/beta fold hydrolase [Bacillus kexueae]|uniref:alpha/beta fold hydrolase n=1 Tax=Aeribacillus kexueae TaxID=2078952 RepID=UPI001FAF4ECB|nr:alpha/beta fold hydrolase [Bacillus kexueae]
MSSIIIQRDQVQDIPALHLVKQSLQHERLPFILFIHGYTSAKEHNLHYAYLLAEKGFRVVLPDVKFHGERVVETETELHMQFWRIVLHTIHELNTLKEFYEQQNLMDHERIGVVGTSMGGIITLGALTQYQWIKTAVSLMGNPAYGSFFQMQIQHLKQQGINIPFTDEQLAEQMNQLKPYDLSTQLDKLANRPLLFWHGKKDQVVPFAPAYKFYEEILPLYAENPERIHFEADEHAGHKVSRKGVLLTVEWFEKHLLHNVRNKVETSL